MSVGTLGGREQFRGGPVRPGRNGRHEQDAETVYYGAFEAAGVEPFGGPDELWAALSNSPAPDPDDRFAYLADGFGRVADRHGRSVGAAALAGGFVAVVDHSTVAFYDGAARALYVGDSLEYDVAGAKGAGLRAAWCPANGESDPGRYDPDYVLGSPADLVDVLDGSG